MTDTLRVGIIYPDGTITTKSVDRSNELREMQALVGGYLQAIEVGDITYWCDEEVKFKPHEVNVEATRHCVRALHEDGRMLMPGDYLGGTIVITGGADSEGKTLDVPGRVIDELVNP